jgi:dTDP-4-dehydrorhamnose reductase
MKFYLIGASGNIGWPLYKFLKKKINITGTYNSVYRKELVKFNVCNFKKSKVLKLFKKNDVIIMMAAKTDIPWVYNNYKKSLELSNKIISLFRYLIKLKCKIIYVSTAEVFDGKKGFYDEDSKPKPIHRYGMTKYKIENFLSSSGYNNYNIIRTAQNVSNSFFNNCIIKKTYESLRKKNALIASDNFFSITHSDDFNIIFFKIIKKKIKKKILHIASNIYLSRVQLAKLIIKFSKFKNLMSFKETKMRNLSTLEPKVAKSTLVSKKTEKILNFNNFIPPEIIIKRKVSVIDKFLKK